MANEKKIPVGGWLDPTTPEHILGSSSDIIDEELKKRQSEVNLLLKNTNLKVAWRKTPKIERNGYTISIEFGYGDDLLDISVYDLSETNHRVFGFNILQSVYTFNESQYLVLDIEDKNIKVLDRAIRKDNYIILYFDGFYDRGVPYGILTEVYLKNGIDTNSEKVKSLEETSVKFDTEINNNKKNIESIAKKQDAILVYNSIVPKKINYENLSIDAQGNTYPNNTRALSGYLPLRGGCLYKIIKKLDFSKKYSVSFYLFDSIGGNVLMFTSFLQEVFSAPKNTHYMRIYLSCKDEVSEIKAFDFVDNQYIDLKSNVQTNESIKVDLGAIKYEKKAWGGDGAIWDNANRVTSDKIPLPSCIIDFKFNCGDTYRYALGFYHKDGSFDESYERSATETNHAFSDDIAAIRIQVYYKDELKPLSLEDFKKNVIPLMSFKYKVQPKTSEIKRDFPLQIGCQNVCQFFYREDKPKGDKEWAKWKASFVNNFNKCDIISFTEWNDSYDLTHKDTKELFGHIFPYWYSFKNLGADTPKRLAIFSKYPCSFDIKRFNFEMIIATFIVGGSEIKYCTWLQSGAKNERDNRISAYRKAIDYFKDDEKVIIAGDFNNSEGADELEVWLEGGFKLGNNGYWGEIATCITPENPPFAAIDNIVVKGLNMFDFSCVKNDANSDHYPIFANLNI